MPPVIVEHEGKEKPRYCHDAKAECRGISLNNMLIPGNACEISVFNALQNARRFDWFAIGDIKDFFHRVMMPEEDRDALRFFRWVPGKEDELQCLRMKVNLFGSACSATIAQFALRKNAKDHGQEYGPQVHDAINGCYVDDVPMTAPTEEELVKGPSKEWSNCVHVVDSRL